MRIGAFLFDSQDALLSESLKESIRTPKKETAEILLQKEGYCLLHNIKTGIWIAGNSLKMYNSFYIYIDQSIRVS